MNFVLGEPVCEGGLLELCWVWRNFFFLQIEIIKGLMEKFRELSKARFCLQGRAVFTNLLKISRRK